MSKVAPLSCRDLCWQKAQRALLSHVTMSLGDAELVAVIGPNGAGKSSLLRSLMGLIPEAHGNVMLSGRLLQSMSMAERAIEVAYLPQQQPVAWPLSVRHTVELGRLPHMGFRRQLNTEDQSAVEEAMQMADVAHLADRRIDTLSGGELSRVMIARLFAGQAPIILADEPIAALDPYHQLHIMELLQRHCQRGGSAMVVMHDLTMAARFCQRIVVMQKGEVVADGRPHDVLTDDLLASVYGVSVKRHHDLVVPDKRLG
ncbi:MAG TPA: ABC transporter ATP-binding protein [Pseudomonadales bacterium]|nr:ABC transporter ATP-binding protein [Pseudomonadales bacterium]